MISSLIKYLSSLIKLINIKWIPIHLYGKNIRSYDFIFLSNISIFPEIVSNKKLNEIQQIRGSLESNEFFDKCSNNNKPKLPDRLFRFNCHALVNANCSTIRYFYSKFVRQSFERKNNQNFHRVRSFAEMVDEKSRDSLKSTEQRTVCAVLYFLWIHERSDVTLSVIFLLFFFSVPEARFSTK